MPNQSSNIRRETGLSNEDTKEIKVFMASFNDAIRCSQEIAQKDTSTDHFKTYLKLLLDARRKNSELIMIDKEGDVIASKDLPTSTIFGLMKFSQQKHE